MKLSIGFFCIPIALFLSSCHSTHSSEEVAEEAKSDSLPSTTTKQNQEPIETYILTGKTFYQELSGNGKVAAQRAAEIRFKTTERIAHIWVKNGERVRAGQRLAELDKFRLEHSLAQAKDNLEQSKLELQDVLIGRGYSLEEIDRKMAANDDEFNLARVKSGYNKALIAYELATEELANATLTAPFSGVVANLTAKADNLSSTGEAFCLIIDDARPEVTFNVLESELAMVKPGYRVAVIPFAITDPSARVWGEVIEVNPYVESNGMVKVKARVTNNGQLIEGMNVKVTLRQPLDESLVIPKSAVVMRSGKPVVFTLTHGKAQWNYVKVLAENSDSCIVAPRSKEYEGLSAGDTIVVRGNLNLAHDTEMNRE